MTPFRVVVTGGIGCGKSTATSIVMDRLKPYGFELFDFDAEVHKLYEDDRVRQDLMDEFDTTDRHIISDRVHANPAAMAVIREIMDRNILNVLRDFDKKLRVVYDIPLYYEWIDELAIPNYPYVICVTAAEYMQIARVKARNGWSEEKIRSVIAKQLNQHEKALWADTEIRNNFADVEDYKLEVHAEMDWFIQLYAGVLER